MKKNFLAAAAASIALVIPAAAVYAQDTMVTTDAAGDVYVMTAVQQGAYDTWPADQQGMYDGWPYTIQSYYWTLTPEQQVGWWMLNDDQRARVFAMTPEQRTAAWTAISAQMNAKDSANASATAQMASSGNMQFVTKAMVQPVTATSDSAALASGDLPVCKAGQQDGCINSWEKNKTGTRPLNYWPGKPASSE